MDQKGPKVFNRKIAAEDDYSNSSEIARISQQFGNLFPVHPSSDAELEIEPESVIDSTFADDEKKESEDIHARAGGGNHSYSSPKRALLSSTTSAFAKTERDQKSRNKRQSTYESIAQDVAAELQQQASTPMYRRASPIARMRSSGIQEAAALEQSVLLKLVSMPKSDKEMIKVKRRKWKRKMSIAQATPRQGRKAMDDGSVLSNQFHGTGIISCVLDNVEGTKLFKQFTQCGDMADGASEYEESEFESSTSGGSHSEEDEEEYAALGAQRARRRRKAGRSRKPLSRGSSVEPSGGSSIVSTVREEMMARPGVKFRNDEDGHISTTVGGIEKSVEDELGAAFPRTASLNPTNVRSPETGKAPESKSMKAERKAEGLAASPTMAVDRQNPNRHASSPMSTSADGHIPKDKSFIKLFIEDLKTKGAHMLWHKETSVMHPSTVTIYLSMGYKCPDGSFCGPRLVFTDTKKDQKYGIDLFDIRSLERADPLQLENFPYAMPGRSVFLKLTTGTSFIFEAAAEEDAWNFVRGVQWVVSRLAFNLVIGNLDVSCELLDFDLEEDPANRSPRSAMEFDWSRAMDDVADRLVDKTLSSSMA